MTPSQQTPEEEPVRFTDKRRIDPQTGQVRAPVGEEGVVEAEVAGFHDAEPTAGEEAGLTEGAVQEPDALQTELLERTADLQRVTAEYANYRRRVERDRQTVIDGAKASVVTSLLGVLDDVDRAREHGDLHGPFKAVADKLGDVLSGLGVSTFGVAGDPFDPAQHEAVAHEGSGGEPVLSTVMRQGYRFGDRVLRPAMVAVSETPSETVPETPRHTASPNPAAAAADDPAEAAAETAAGLPPE